MRWRSARTIDESYMASPTAFALGGPELVVWVLSAIYPSKRSNAPKARASLTFPRSHYGVRQTLRVVSAFTTRLELREKIGDLGPDSQDHWPILTMKCHT